MTPSEQTASPPTSRIRTMDSVKLEPCPNDKCSSQPRAVVLEVGRRHGIPLYCGHVRCDNCGVHGPTSAAFGGGGGTNDWDAAEADAAEFWNALPRHREASRAGVALPIASAPKDGSWFIAAQDGERYPCQWEVSEPDEGAPHEGWFDIFNQSFEAPTHWYPLPGEEAPTTPAPDLEAVAALDWLARNRNLELSYYSPVYGDDDDQDREWRVTKVSGPINDREWDIAGRGETPLSAILAALQSGAGLR